MLARVRSGFLIRTTKEDVTVTSDAVRFPNQLVSIDVETRATRVGVDTEHFYHKCGESLVSQSRRKTISIIINKLVGINAALGAKRKLVIFFAVKVLTRSSLDDKVGTVAHLVEQELAVFHYCEYRAEVIGQGFGCSTVLFIQHSLNNFDTTSVGNALSKRNLLAARALEIILNFIMNKMHRVANQLKVGVGHHRGILHHLFKILVVSNQSRFVFRNIIVLDFVELARKCFENFALRLCKFDFLKVLDV